MEEKDKQQQGQQNEQEGPASHNQSQDPKQDSVIGGGQGKAGEQSREAQIRSDEAKERDESWRPSDDPAAGDLAPDLKANAPHLEPGKTGSEW